MAEINERSLEYMKEVARKSDPNTVRRIAAAARDRAQMYARWSEDEEHRAAVWQDLATEREEGRL